MTTTQVRRKYTSYRDERLQAKILRLVDMRQWGGMTVHELRQAIPEHEAHHGWISGALSELHRTNRLARLSDKRAGCKIYVTPDFIDSRPCEAQGHTGLSKEEILFFEDLDTFMNYWMRIDTDGARITTDRTKAERNHRLFFTELRKMWEDRP